MTNQNMLLITTTSGRPTAFNDYLTKFIKRQTFQEFEHLVVCDNDEGYKFPKKTKVVLREPAPDDPHSMVANWRAALQWIEDNGEHYERFAVLEDDDWYADNYLYELNRMLDRADLAGFCEDAYYFVLSRRAHRCHNRTFAALAATGFRRKVLPFLKTCLENGQTDIDTQLWVGTANTPGWSGPKALCDNFTGLDSNVLPKTDEKGNIPNNPRHIGCKENWHKGTGNASEYPISGGFDTMGKVAVTWFGEDAASYLKYTRTPQQGTPFLLLEMAG